MTRDCCRGVAVLLCLLLIAVPLACAADCPEGCSCMTASAAKQGGYSPCGGKLTLCGKDLSGNPKYCYLKPTGLAGTGSSSGQPSIPHGWFSYRASAQVRNEENNVYENVVSTLRYDITSESYSGRTATRVRMDMQTTASQGTVRVHMDEYLDPVSNAILGGTATVTSGGKTQSVNLADLTSMAQTNSASGSAQPHQYVTANFENNMRTIVAGVPGCRYSKNSEPVTVSAGTFSSATRYTLTCTDGGETSTMYYWITPGVPVTLKMQVKDTAGTASMVTELTGYKFTGSSSSEGPLAGILSGGENGGTVSGGSSPEDQPDLDQLGSALEQVLQDLLPGTGAPGDGSGPLVDWDEIPGAMAGSLTPATLGAFGALLGGAAGAFSLLFPGGFPEAGGQGGDGGEGPGSDEDADTVSVDGWDQIHGGQGDNPDTVFHGGQGPGGCS